MKIVVIGAGIAGTLSAYYLAQAGAEVTIIERESEAAMACSRANGGQISVCNSQTWNTVENVRKGLGWMLQADAPLLIRPAPSFAKIKWLSGFLYNVLNGTHQTNTLETISLGLQSRALYENIIAEHNLEFDQLKAGMLGVYTSEKALNIAQNDVKMFTEAGLEQRILSVEEVIALDPAMKNFKGLLGGIFTESDFTGDPHLFCKALGEIMRAEYGVKYIFNQEVTYGWDHGVEALFMNGQPLLDIFDRVVVANGHEMTNIASHLGDSMNVYPVKGYSVTINVSGNQAPHVSLLDDGRKIVSSRLGDRFRIAGTAELTGPNTDIRTDRIKPLLDWVRNNFPEVDISSYSPWACLRPMNSNMMPIVRRSRNKKIWYHGGHGHLGWTLGAATSLKLLNAMQNDGVL